jgi:hypothetical protein
MADNKTNPSGVGTANEYYAQNLGLSRPDASIVGPGGNTVDRGAINKTLNVLDKNSTQSKPLGQSGTTGF